MGSILVRFGPNLGSKLFGFLIFYAYPCTVAIALSLVASNVAGYTKKTVATAMVFIGYCVGNITGPFLFFAREKPRYPVGAKTPLFGLMLTQCMRRAVSMQLPSASVVQSSS